MLQNYRSAVQNKNMPTDLEMYFYAGNYPDFTWAASESPRIEVVAPGNTVEERPVQKFANSKLTIGSVVNSVGGISPSLFLPTAVSNPPGKNRSEIQVLLTKTQWTANDPSPELRPYYAFIYIDMIESTESTDSDMFARAKKLAKAVFLLNHLDLSAPNAQETFEAITLELVNEVHEFSTGSGSTESLEAANARNVETSTKVRNNSDLLLKNRDIVQMTQDRLRALSSSDEHAQRMRTYGWGYMIAAIVVAVTVFASFVFLYLNRRQAEIYLIGAMVSTVVVFFEAFRGAERLLAIPDSVYDL